MFQPFRALQQISEIKEVRGNIFNKHFGFLSELLRYDINIIL